MKRFEVRDRDRAPLPAVDLADDVVVIGAAADARIRLPVPYDEHVRIAGDRWIAAAELAAGGVRHAAGASGPIGDGVELELGAYRVRVAPAPAGAASSPPQRTESLARELMRSLLGANAAPSLEVVGGPARGARRELPPPEAVLVIGRGDGAGWVILDEDLSREHAEIRCGWDGVTVRDLESKNGTRVDGAPITGDGVELHDGARLDLGNVELVFRDPAERHLRGEPLSAAPAQAAAQPALGLPPQLSPWPFVIAAAIAGVALVAAAWVVMG